MLELRQDAGEGPGIVSGVAVNYGEVSRQLTISGIRERIDRGAFGQLDGPIFANLGHQKHLLLGSFPEGGLSFQDGPDALRFTLELPPTTTGQDAGELIRRKVLRAASIEFRRERTRAHGRVLVVSRGRLMGLALVHRPAYPGAAIEEIRHLLELEQSPPTVKRPKRWLV